MNNKNCCVIRLLGMRHCVEGDLVHAVCIFGGAELRGVQNMHDFLLYYFINNINHVKYAHLCVIPRIAYSACKNMHIIPKIYHISLGEFIARDGLIIFGNNWKCLHHIVFAVKWNNEYQFVWMYRYIYIYIYRVNLLTLGIPRLV